MRSERVHITPRVPPLGLRSRVQDFSSSSRVTPPPALRVYFTPQPPIGFHLQGFALPRSRVNSSPTLCRLAVLHRLRSRHLVDGTFGARTLQFLGVGPVPFAGFTAFFPLRVRTEWRLWLASSTGRAPLGISPRQGLPDPRDATARHRSSSHVLGPASAPPGFPNGPSACCTTECPSHR